MNRILKAALIVSFILILLANTASAAVNASVELHGEKTDVVLGEDIILKLSAVNIITKPTMTVQVILIPPSGMSVSSSEFVTSGAGQFTSTFNISTGAGRDIEVRIQTNQAGDFNVKGRVIYYFGGDISTAEESTLNLPIKVRAPPVPVKTGVERVTGLSINEVIIIGIAVLLLVFGILYKLKRDRVAALTPASVHLHGEKTDVVLGEDVMLKLSAVNSITKPAMTVQLILIPPSGMSVASSDFVSSGAGQYTTTYTIDPGAGKDFEVRMKANQAGDFEVKGRLVYYYGKDKGNAEDHALSLPIKVKPGETEYERAGRLGVADVRSQHAVKSEVLEFGRQQKVKEAETDMLIEQKESEADFEEAKRGIEALKLLKQAKAEGKKAGDDKEGDDKGTTIKFGRSGSITEKGSIIQRSNIGAGAMKKCPHCGAALPKYAGFCGECGGKL